MDSTEQKSLSLAPRIFGSDLSASLGELAKEALNGLWDERRGFKHYLRAVRRHWKDGQKYARHGDLDEAYKQLLRAAILALEKLPQHRHYLVWLNCDQRYALHLVRTSSIRSNPQHMMWSYQRDLQVVPSVDDGIFRGPPRNTGLEHTRTPTRQRSVVQVTRRHDGQGVVRPIGPISISSSSQDSKGGAPRLASSAWPHPGQLMATLTFDHGEPNSSCNQNSCHLSTEFEIACRHWDDGKERAQRGDLEGAFVRLASAATMMLEKLLLHQVHQRTSNNDGVEQNSLSQIEVNLLDNLGAFKSILDSRYSQWVYGNPESSNHKVMSDGKFETFNEVQSSSPASCGGTKKEEPTNQGMIVQQQSAGKEKDEIAEVTKEDVWSYIAVASVQTETHRPEKVVSALTAMLRRHPPITPLSERKKHMRPSRLGIRPLLPDTDCITSPNRDDYSAPYSRTTSTDYGMYARRMAFSYSREILS
ncbi:hypothetical protein CVT26_006284 [Gymnopilus dilepis]|uniref:Uncharacterized protein n=1 Tax=Gymnopilus dilepis TaxID=231916 RepID=A0A409VYN5_9AGAR|nr:hypothetical protein CVT26_006284 [Gymnopilus dilepis]